MSGTIISPPTDSSSEDHSHLWQTYAPLGVALAAAGAGYYFFGHVKAASYGNLLEFVVLGCFVLFSAVFVILNKEIDTLDAKAKEFRLKMADALLESKELNKRANDGARENSG